MAKRRNILKMLGSAAGTVSTSAMAREILSEEPEKNSQVVNQVEDSGGEPPHQKAVLDNGRAQVKFDNQSEYANDGDNTPQLWHRFSRATESGPNRLDGVTGPVATLGEAEFYDFDRNTITLDYIGDVEAHEETNRYEQEIGYLINDKQVVVTQRVDLPDAAPSEDYQVAIGEVTLSNESPRAIEELGLFPNDRYDQLQILDQVGILSRTESLRIDGEEFPLEQGITEYPVEQPSRVTVEGRQEDAVTYVALGDTVFDQIIGDEYAEDFTALAPETRLDTDEEITYEFGVGIHDGGYAEEVEERAQEISSIKDELYGN